MSPSRRNHNLRRTMSDLPSEIITEILSFVPAQSLLRFKCVSKSWCALIDSPNFIKLHLNRAMQTNSDRKVFCLPLRRCYTGDFNLMEETNRVEYAEICYPFHNYEKYSTTEIAGSCHGVLYLYNSLANFALWNPTTRRSVELPNSKYNLDGEVTNHGFGPEGEAEVFSLKSNSWRSISPFPYQMEFSYEGFGVLAGGSLHWVLYSGTESEKTYFIAAFDLGTEECRLVPQPDYPCEKYFLHLTVLGESLCACIEYVDPYNNDYYDFWVMKKYGCKDSWTKLFTYPSSPRFSVRPLAYSRRGRQVLILEANQQFWYDLETGEVKFSTKVNSLLLNFSHMCFGSLVQLDGSISDDVALL